MARATRVQTRRITRPRTGTRAGQRRRRAVATGWTLAADGVVTFATAPAAGAAVRAGFLFDVPVRFAEDRLEVAGAAFAAGEAPSVPIIEVREAVMSRVWFASELETVATFWRVMRRDGVTLGFTSHDRDLWFDGVLHRAAPGMVPSAIRRSADFEPTAPKSKARSAMPRLPRPILPQGRFDGAQVRIGLIDWESGEHEVLYRGAIGGVTEEAGRFTAELVSRKAELERDPVPRTSPSAARSSADPAATSAPARFTHEATLSAVDLDANAVIAGRREVLPPSGSAARCAGSTGRRPGCTMTVMARPSTAWCSTSRSPRARPGHSGDGPRGLRPHPRHLCHALRQRRQFPGRAVPARQRPDLALPDPAQ